VLVERIHDLDAAGGRDRIDRSRFLILLKLAGVRFRNGHHRALLVLGGDEGRIQLAAATSRGSPARGPRLVARGIAGDAAVRAWRRPAVRSTLGGGRLLAGLGGWSGLGWSGGYRRVAHHGHDLVPRGDFGFGFPADQDV